MKRSCLRVCLTVAMCNVTSLSCQLKPNRPLVSSSAKNDFCLPSQQFGKKKKFANDVWDESKQQGGVYLPLRDTSSSWRLSLFDKGAPTSREFYQKQLRQPGIAQRQFVFLISVG